MMHIHNLQVLKETHDHDLKPHGSQVVLQNPRLPLPKMLVKYVQYSLKTIPRVQPLLLNEKLHI